MLICTIKLLIVFAIFSSDRNTGGGDEKLCCKFIIRRMNKIMKWWDLILNRGGSLIAHFPINLLNFKSLLAPVVSKILLFKL